MSNNFDVSYGESARNGLSGPKNLKSLWKLRGHDPEKSAPVFDESPKAHNHKIEVNNENLDLLVILTGQLAPDKKTAKDNAERTQVAAKLTENEFLWADKSLKLVDIVSVSYVLHTRRFIIHSFPFKTSRWSCTKAHRKRKDLYFLAPTPDDAAKWVSAFQSQKCFVNYTRQPLPASKRQGTSIESKEPPLNTVPGSQTGPAMMVILNPRSGSGRARKIYDSKVEPILKLAGLRLTVVETNGPNHAQSLAANADISTCEDGIICVGGDGIVNEVLNGLMNREDVKESKNIPIGIIPAGSDNSLVWSVMGIRDPVSAAIAIVKGGLVSTDIISVEWMKTGDVQLGHTITYYGFMSDVLELSEKYQKRFGPLRYFVAGALKFLCLSGYECEVEYLPFPEKAEAKIVDKPDTSLSCFNEIDDIEKGSRGLTPEAILMMPFGDHDILTGSLDASSEPSEYVRGFDSKLKWSPPMRVPMQTGVDEVLAVNHSIAGPVTPSRPRSRSKSRTDKGWPGRNSGNASSRNSWDYSMVDSPGESHSMSGEELSSPLGTRWVPQQESEVDQASIKHGFFDDDNWVVKQGPFLGIMVCNHKCKTVQCLKTQMLAPNAEHDGKTLELLMVRNVGRFQLLRFLILMQFGCHLSLPFVECIKVRSVKLRPGNKSPRGCGIDGELVTLNGPLTVTLLNQQCQMFGFPATVANE